MFHTLIAATTLLSACVASFGETQEQADNRHIALEGQSNFRDLGGYQTRDGKTTKRGLVFRSGELARLTDEDVSKLEKLGIKTVVNFLIDEEMNARGKDRLPSGVREVSLPIESDGNLVEAVSEARKTADFSKVPANLNPEFHRILVGEGKQQYASLLREITKTEKPMVFHCSHGVHRTGTATAILLWSLGVPWETVREDYLLSNTYRQSEIDKRLEQLRELAAQNQGVKPEEVDMTNINAFYILQREYIDAMRDEILNKYGSIEKYVSEGLGLSENEMLKLRNRLLE